MPLAYSGADFVYEACYCKAGSRYKVIVNAGRRRLDDADGYVGHRGSHLSHDRGDGFEVAGLGAKQSRDADVGEVLCSKTARLLVGVKWIREQGHAIDERLIGYEF